MSSRDTILNALRTTLNRADLPFPPVNPPALTGATRMTVTRADGCSRDLAERFGRELSTLHGSYEIVETASEARLALISRLLSLMAEAERMRSSGALVTGQERKVLSWQPEMLPVPGLADSLADMEIELVAPEEILSERDRNAVRHIPYGLTGVEAAFASTGSMLMATGAATSRSASLLPLRHIALIPSSRLFPTMEAWLASFEGDEHLVETVRNTANFSMITGPSKSADIGGELTLGVHGPKFVHAILFFNDE